METIAFLLYYVTPYAAVVVFFGGIAYRLYRWRQKSPVAVHLSLFPRPQGRLGRLVDTLVDEWKEAGVYRTTWDATDVASGVYFYKLQTHTGLEADRLTETRKLILVR